MVLRRVTITGFLMVVILHTGSSKHIRIVTRKGYEPQSVEQIWTSGLFCTGQLLETIQMSRIFKDGKTFVDMSMKTDPDVILKKFASLPDNPDQETLRAFVEENFNPKGSDSESVTPDDWRDRPSFLENIEDPNTREWASHLNDLWKKLFKKIIPDVTANPQRYSLLPVPHHYVVPGGRFGEIYYWDSYWTFKGLLVCEMTTSVKAMFKNYVSLIERFGYIPNSSRVYNLDRSQPPLFANMVEDYLTSTDDYSILDEVLPALEKEYRFWTETRGVEVSVNGNTYRLQRYQGIFDAPRAESYWEDVKAFVNATEKRYTDIRAGCESGLDFSSRWFSRTGAHKMTLASIRTTKVIPVDLNSIMFMTESAMAKMYGRIGNLKRQNYFQRQAEIRAKAIEDVFWIEQLGSWFDYDAEHNISRPYFYATCGFPVYAGCHGTTKEMRSKREEKFLKYLQQSGVLDYPGGIPTSLDNTGQQWDYPNAWPPLVHVVIMGLAQSQAQCVKDVALELAKRWLTTNYIGWKKHGHMFEKYNVEEHSPGKGGEYEVQVGFAWTNGVVLDFIRHFGNAIGAIHPNDVPN